MKDADGRIGGPSKIARDVTYQSQKQAQERTAADLRAMTMLRELAVCLRARVRMSIDACMKSLAWQLPLVENSTCFTSNVKSAFDVDDSLDKLIKRYGIDSAGARTNLNNSSRPWRHSAPSDPSHRFVEARTAGILLRR